jgi:FkbM family methyltransferase
MNDPLPKVASGNPIRDWSGVLDLTEPLGKHVRPLVEQHRSGRPHEREFELFGRLAGVAGSFVDIGANAGQSAISLRSVNDSLRIVVFEPNPALEPLLRCVRDELLSGFEYHMFGCSDHEGEFDLWIPVVDNAYVTPLASTRPEIFAREEDRARLLGFSLHGRYELRRVTARLRRLDDLGLVPSVVKVDAEEHEMQCLRGMVETLRRAQPLCMFEHNSQTGEVMAFLAGLGYRPFLYDARQRRLVPYPAAVEATNIFYVPADERRVRESGCLG